MSGWIKLHRSLLDWEWYDDQNSVRLLIHLLVTVNHEPSRYHGHVIPAGSRVAGRSALAAELGLSERSIRTALEHLKESGEVTIKTTSKFSIITMTKWDRLQDQRPATSPASDQRPTSNRPHLKNERIKEEKKKEDIELPLWVPLADWSDYLDMRKAKKVPTTTAATKLLISKLTTLRDDGHNPAAVIQAATMNGWKSFYPIKGDDHARPHRETAKERNAREAAELLESFRQEQDYAGTDRYHQ